MIVVDTSVLVDFFRGRETPGSKALDRLEEERHHGPQHVDCLIAQMVLDAGAHLLPDDADFEVIPTVRPLRTFHAFANPD